ncbi:hypothetical protein [Amycolatopsis sp. FDAARGOS 1241]|uniref:hypothetical protein n=1 Tax=Amycolatopsis sp. FDAARGOS 1241 TaxID=2778070 RepID=UPI0019526D6E|nr:hypothetical protein [Amycolatopsis sp. FDAARGOS 1241]QRP43547.1 hypothetical protein I6J71_29665 [Amycolatopsis sp. FDAARGOS 1241]
MVDGYFGLQPSSPDDDRTGLLSGVSDDLLDGANDALDGLQYLRYAEYFSFALTDEIYRQRQEEVVDVFRDFSSADLTDQGDGLQAMINDYELVWKNLGRHSITELRRAKELMTSWRGDAAEDVKTYLDRLSETYDQMATEISVLESDVVAARDAVWGARRDLTNLAATFKDTAQKYQEAKAKEGEISLSKVMTTAFSAALIGLLAAVATPAAAGVEITLAAAGTQAAVAGAGAGLSEVVAEGTARIEGDNANDIYQSFFDNVDKLRTAMHDSTGDLVAKIREKADALPEIPTPPDVSPGATFDPDAFETTHTSKRTEDNARRENVDIAPDGGLSRPMTPSRLD